MAIDTANKRKSVINFSIPGACLLPISDGAISSVDRRHLCESYQITPVTVRRGGWVQGLNSGDMWTKDKDLNDIWVQDKDVTFF